MLAGSEKESRLLKLLSSCWNQHLQRIHKACPSPACCRLEKVEFRSSNHFLDELNVVTGRYWAVLGGTGWYWVVAAMPWRQGATSQFSLAPPTQAEANRKLQEVVSLSISQESLLP